MFACLLILPLLRCVVWLAGQLVHVCWERSGSSGGSELERQLAKFVAWKRLTDEDERLFAISQ